MSVLAEFCGPYGKDQPQDMGGFFSQGSRINYIQF